MAGQSSGVSVGYENIGSSYYSTGSLTSSVIDAGNHGGYTTLDFVTTLPANTALTIDIRAGDTSTPDGSWTAWQTNVANGGDISIQGGRRYIQYQVNLSTSNVLASPELNSITINFNNFPVANSSQVKNGTVNLNLVSQTVSWTYNSAWNAPDNGSYAKPAFADIDNDGDIDMLIGDSTGISKAYENTGNNTSPAWTLRSGWNAPSIGTYASPLFADLDNDGDYDLLIGAYNGTTLGFENTGNNTAPVWTAKTEWNVPDVGTMATPSLADLDDDGDLDLILGNSGGSTLAYENTGSVSAPVWTVNNAYRNTSDIGTYSAPLMTDLDGDGDFDMLIGAYSGLTYGYRNTGSVSAPAWSANTAWNINYDVGVYAAPALADLDGDLDGDVLIGNSSGLSYGQENTGTPTFATSGDYYSAVIDGGVHTGYLTLDYTITTPASTSISVDVRAGDTVAPDGSWTVWQTGIVNGGDISALGTRRYFQYRLNLSTTDTSVTPNLEEITVNRGRHVANVSLISSAYDSADSGNLIDGISWNESLGANSDVQIQIRTAADAAGAPGAWSNWTGPDSTSTSFWNSANSHSSGCSGSGSISCVTIPAGLRDGVADQWFQYKLTMISDGGFTATLSDVSVHYATANISGPGGISVSALSGPTTEAGGTATFTMVLDNAPSADVTLHIYSDDVSEGTLSPSTLTFTSGNWSSPQTVTLTGVNDNLDDGDIGYNVVIGSSNSADPNYDDINPANIVVTNVDDDSVGVTVTPTSGLITNESGATDSFSVVLTSEPTANVTIDMTSSDTGEGTVSPSSLIFTPSNWNTSQTVTLTGVDDAGIDHAVAYTVLTSTTSADGNYAAIDPADVSASNEDNDTPDIIVDAPFGLTTSESGGFAPITITLSSQPTATVSFMLSSSDSSEGWVSPFSMTFTPDDWNTPHTATIYGVNDGDVDGDIGFSVVTSLMTSADSDYNTANPSDISVTNIDDDAYGVSIDPVSGLTTTEFGGQASFRVWLGATPASDVTINFTSSDPSEGTVSPASITFTPSEPAWRSKFVTVTGLDDRDFDGDQAYSIVTTLVSSDPNYSAIDPADVAITNIDNNQNSYTHLQNDITSSMFGSYVTSADVNCDLIPDLIVGTEGQVYDEVYVYHGSSSGYSNTPNWIGRDTLSNTDFGSRVFGVGDLNKDGCEDIVISAPDDTISRGTVYLYHGSPTGLADADMDGIGRPSDAVWEVTGDQSYAYLGHSVTAGDFNGDGYDDLAMSAILYDAGLSNEGRIYLFLNSASGLPDADMNGIALVSENSWIFESDYSSGQAGLNQGLAAANVNGDAYMDLMIGVTYHTNGQSYEGRTYAFYGSTSGFNDADSDGIARPADADWKAESDMSNGYLGNAIANAGDLNGDGADDILVGATRYTNGQTYEGAALIFYGANPGGLPDADMDGTARLSDAGWQTEGNDTNAYFGSWLSSAGDYNGDGYDDVMVGAYNYDTGAGEGGAVFIYAGSAGGVATSPEKVLTGTNTGDDFGFRLGNVGDVNNDGYSDIFIAAPTYETTGAQNGEGAVYFYLSNPQNAGISVTPTSGLTTTESGGSASFNVVLDAPPSDDVTIALSSDNVAEGTVSPASLTFDNINWMIPQTVTVNGVNDAVTDSDVLYNIVLATAVSADIGYNGLDPDDVAVLNTDNDVPQEVSVTTSDVNESENGGITFTRSGEITTAMTVYYSVSGSATPGTDYSTLSGSAIIPIGSASVTTTADIYNDAVVEASETIVIDLAPGPGYAIGAPSSATLTITDDDSAGTFVWPSLGLITTEAGGTDSITIRLTSQPSADVTIALSSSAPSEATPLPASVTFTSTNWNVDQVVTVVGQDDVTVDGDASFTIVTGAAVSSDPDYNGIAVTDITGANRDDDSLPTLTLNTTIATLAEGDNGLGVFTVTRSGATTNELRFFYTISGTASSAEDYVALTGVEVIQSGNSSTDINLDTLQDALIEGDETVVITLAPGSDYILTLPTSNTVTILDDDDVTLPQVGLALDQTVGEGSTVTAMLSEAAQNYPVTIPLTISGTATNPEDHDAVNGNLMIASGTSGSISFNVVDDGAGELDETIVISMGTPTNASLGNRTQHTVTISETNEPPKATLSAQQGGVDIRLAITGDGNVLVTGAVEDPNPGDVHSYDWSMTNNNLVDIDDADPTTFVFNPISLAAGFYKVRLNVTDDGVPAESASVELLLQVATSAPTLSGIDSDNDGVADNVESFDDSDGDGIADYLDPSNLLGNELQVTTVETVTYIMHTEPDLTLSLGDVAFAADADGAYVTTDDIAAYGGGEGDPGVASAQDSVVGIGGGYFDFVVSDLPEAGQSVKVVIPLLVEIPGSAVYRKYDPQTGWRDFVVDANNSIASAAGSPGVCPAAGDSSYEAGLNQGDYCVELTIQDGGPNDTDGEINSVVEDPGTIVEGPDTLEETEEVTFTSHGGGVPNYLLLSLLAVLLYLRLGLIRRTTTRVDVKSDS